MESDLQSLFGLHVYSCIHWLRPRKSQPPPPNPPHLGSYTRALLVSQDRRHLFVTPWFDWTVTYVLWKRNKIYNTKGTTVYEKEFLKSSDYATLYNSSANKKINFRITNTKLNKN
jgi:hypothetical protein